MKCRLNFRSGRPKRPTERNPAKGAEICIAPLSHEWGRSALRPFKRLAALEVPKSLRRPHAVIAAWVADHASRVADSKRDKSSWAFPHSQDSC